MSDTSSKRPLRRDIPEGDKWDLSSILCSDEDFDRFLRGLPPPEEVSTAISPYRGRVAESVGRLALLLSFRDSIAVVVERLSQYAMLRVAEDLTDTAALGMRARIDSYASAAGAAFAFIQSELAAAPNLEYLATNEVLSQWRPFLEKVLRLRSHRLSGDQEAVLSLLRPSLSAPGQVFQMWSDVDLSFGFIKDEDGRPQSISPSNYHLFNSSPDRDVRKRALAKFTAGLKTGEASMAVNLISCYRALSTEARLRRYGDSVEMLLARSGVGRGPMASLHEARDILTSGATAVAAYRSKRLGLVDYAWHDRMAPAPMENVGEGGVEITWDEGRSLLLRALSPLGTDYVERLRAGLYERRWVDRIDTEGRSLEAFSAGIHGSEPVIMMSWQDNLESLMTLAHECGHSMHTLYSNEAQPRETAEYPIFLAEIASTMCEHLLLEYLISECPRLRGEAEEMRISNFEHTFIMQAVLAIFEARLLAAVDRGENPSPSEISESYWEILSSVYGEGMRLAPGLRYGWLWIPHFYDPGYVYTYATSYAASAVLADRVLSREAGAVDDVMKFLKAGRSRDPLELMAEVGIVFGRDLYQRAIRRVVGGLGEERASSGAA